MLYALAKIGHTSSYMVNTLGIKVALRQCSIRSSSIVDIYSYI